MIRFMDISFVWSLLILIHDAHHIKQDYITVYINDLAEREKNEKSFALVWFPLTVNYVSQP